MSRHGAAEDGLNRLKNVYRPRYLYGDGLQEPQKTRPGQNILSAIKNCFDDPNSQAYFKKPGNIIRMDSLLSLESGSTMLDSESGEEEDTEQTTPGDEGAVLLEKAATPTGAVRNLTKSFDRTYILEQSAVQNPASPTITLPTKKRLSFKNFTEPEANNIKRMRMCEKDLMCTTEEKESEIQHQVIAAEKKYFTSPRQKRTTLTGFPEKRPSKVVPYPQNSLFQQQDEIEHDNEDEFMIDEVDSFVVNSWISNPKKAKSDLKGSMSAHSKKSQQVNEEAKNIQRDMCDRARVVNKELSSEKFSSHGHITNMSPKNKGGTVKKNLGQRLCENDLDYLSSEVQNLQQTLSNSQIVINTQPASEAALARIRGTSVYIAREVQSPNLKQKYPPESREEVQVPKTKVTSSSKSEYIREIDTGGPFQKQKKHPDPQNMELIQSLKDAADMEEGKRYANADYPKEDQSKACLPEKSGSFGKSNVRTGLSTGKKSLTKKTMQSSAFEQNAHKPVLENIGETEGFATLLSSKILEKPNHLLEIRNPRSPVYSMFLQAATQGHATRYSAVQETPVFNTPHQGEEDDNDFVFDEAALLDCEPLISIPRRGKPLPSKKMIWPERDTGSLVCTDSTQNDMEKDQNNVRANEQNQQVTPKEKSTRKNPPLSDKNFTLNKEKLLDKVNNSIKPSTRKGNKSKSARVDGPNELDEHDNCALSDEPNVKKTSSKKQTLSKTNKGKPVKKAQKKKQTRSKGKPTPLNQNKNNGGQEAVNTGTGSSDEACTPAEIQKHSKSARISIYSKVASPARRNIFSSNENPHVTNLQIASSPYKRVKKKDIENLEFPETVSSQDLKQTHVPNQRLQASAVEKATSDICDQLETGRMQRISRPPSQWWIVSPSQTNKTVLVEPELPSKSLQKENKNKSKKKKSTKKEKIPVANEDSVYKGITETTPNKRQTPLKKGNKKQLEDFPSADDSCAEMPVSVADVKNSASMPNVRDLEMQDSEMQRGFQKMPKPILKKNKRRSKKLISSEESEKEVAELSEDDGYLDNECSVPQAQESRMRGQKLIKPDCQNRNFIVSTLLDACNESPYLIDNAPENTSESGSDVATSSITVGKTLVSPRKVAQLGEIKNTPQLLSIDSERNLKPEPRSQRKSREDLYTSTVGSGPTVPRIVRLTTANEKPITYKPYTSSSGSDNEYEYGTQLHKIISPSKTPNVRRSKRTRVKPLAYWKGERVNYKMRPSGGFLVEGVVPPVEVEPPRKAVAKRRIYNKQKGHIPTYVEPLTEDYVEPAKVLDADTGTITSIDCVRTSENCLYHEPDQPISICKSIRNSAFSTGKLKIGPFQEKGLQFVCMDTIVFYIMTGSVQLTLHLSTYNLKTGDFFYIPPGNMYNVKNLLNEDAVLIFTQIKGGS